MATGDLFAVLKRLDSVHKLSSRVPGLTWVLRAATFVVYRLLELVLGRRHPHVRTARQAPALAIPPAATPSARVLFFTVRGWYAHVGTELVLAHAVTRRGAEARFFLCGGVLEQCNFKPGSDDHVTRPLCWRCTGDAERTISAAGFASTRMEHHVDVAALRRRFDGETAGLGREELLAFEHAGLPVGDHVVPSVQRSLHSGSITDDPSDVATLRGFVVSACVMAELAAALLDAEQPDVVVLTNGLFFEERVMLELARRRGARVFVYERGIPANTVITAVDRPVIPFDVDAVWRRRRDHELSEDEDARLAAMLRDRLGGNVGVQRIWPELRSEGDAVVRRLGLDPSRSLSTLFTNLLWDTAVFRMDVAFDGMFDWVEATVAAFAELPDQQLVVRVHPAEVRLPLEETRDRVAQRLAERFPTLPGNVRVVPPEDPTNSYDLVARSDRVLTYSSTVGLEAALLGRNVVVGGDTHYRGRGFTVDVDDRDGYPALLADAATRGPLAADRIALARRYGYGFFFEFMREFPWLDDRSRGQRRFRTELVDDLGPGGDPRMDELCGLILGGGG